MSETPYLSHLFAKARMSGTPLGGTFELTSRCNLNCEMCYIHCAQNDAAAKSRELTAAQWLDIARDARDAGTVMLLLTGGEPLVHPDFKTIYRECAECGMLVSVNTNGTLIDNDILELFSQYPPSKLNISLYGSSPQTYERLCKNGAMYERVTKAIDELCTRSINVKLNFSISRENMCDIESVIAFAKARHLTVQSASYMFPPVRVCEGCRDNDARLTPKQAGECAALAARCNSGERSFERLTQDICESIQSGEIPTSTDENDAQRMLCRAGACTYWITCEGAMLACGMMTSVKAQLKDKSFAECWEQIKQQTQAIRLPSECGKCTLRRLCDVCAASCFAETGSFDGLPLYQCEKTRSFYDSIKNTPTGEGQSNV